MKYRHGFVSNSSSSSFVVIGGGALELEGKYKNEHLDLTRMGECEFGWASCVYDTVWDRMNFAKIQAMSVKNEAWEYMIDEVIMEHTGALSVDWDITTEYDCKKSQRYAYIDHQSCATEGENIEIFESKGVLRRFLFCEDSFIQGGNDN